MSIVLYDRCAAGSRHGIRSSLRSALGEALILGAVVLQLLADRFVSVARKGHGNSC